MNRAKLLLCGIAIGFWAGSALSAESSGQWEPRDRGRVSKVAELPPVPSAWEYEPSASGVRQTSVQTPSRSAVPPSEIKPQPDYAASGKSKANGQAGSQSTGDTPEPLTTPAPNGMVVPDDAAVVDGEVPMGEPAGEWSPGWRGRRGSRAFDLYGDDGCGPTDCRPCRPMPILGLSAGVHGFKGPTDQGRNGNFGFQEGVNWSSSVFRTGISYQLGMNATQSNFSKDQTPGVLHDGERDQIFVTTGLFHRAVCGGLQWGLAYDYLRDGYLENFELHQFRAETSVVFEEGGEFGFWGAFGVNTDDFQYASVEATDIYAFFLRKTVESGGQGRLWVGWTPQGPLVGGDLHIPLGSQFALENSFNYLIPQGNDSDDDTGLNQKHEAWSLSVNLVWYLGRNPCLHTSPVRALMPVADNSYFMVNTRP
jgi:hypothetical protein